VREMLATCGRTDLHTWTPAHLHTCTPAHVHTCTLHTCTLHTCTLHTCPPAPTHPWLHLSHALCILS